MAIGFVSIPVFSTPVINPPPGRIAIVADGNSPDPDDLGATAVSIALLRATGLEERLVHYSHSCDLVRGSRISAEAEKERHGLMQTSCDGTASRWGGRGTWDWILNSPERFAAAAPCGFSSISDDDDIERLVNLPIWGMVGASDGKNVESVKKMADLLRASGNPNVRYTAFPEADHAKGNAAVFSSVEWIDWMMTFSLLDQ